MIMITNFVILALVCVAVADSCQNITLIDGVGLVCCRNGTFSWSRDNDIVQFTDILLDECRQFITDRTVESSDHRLTIVLVVGGILLSTFVLLVITIKCIVRVRFRHVRLNDHSVH